MQTKDFNSINSNNKSITSKKLNSLSVDATDIKEWIKNNFSEVIILKDFEVDFSNYISKRLLPQKTIPYFDINLLKNEIIFPNTKAKTNAEKILSILMNSNIRRGPLSTIEPYISNFLEKIIYFVNRNKPIQLILPSLPHKKINPMTTGHSINFVDLGEYLCIQQLKNIILSIKAIYKPGAEIVLLPDGLIFAHIFARNNISGVMNYQKNIEKIINTLGLSSVFKINNLNNLISDVPLFNEIKAETKKNLFSLYLNDFTINKGMSILKKAMLFNLPFEHSLEFHISLMEKQIESLPQRINEQLEFSAFEYASILLTLKKIEIIKTCYPNGIRTSVHSKNTANLPINLINKTSLIFPYNGIPVVRRERFERCKNIRTSTRIMRISDIYKYPSSTAVYRKGESEPFNYEIDSLNEV